MLLQFLTIARNTFIESVRQPVVFLLVMLSGLFQLLNTWNTGFAINVAIFFLPGIRGYLPA